MSPDSATGDGSPPQQFAIATPADWMVVDVELLGDLAVVGGLVDQRVAEQPALAPYRDELAELVARTSKLAEQTGVMFCATLATTRDDGAPILATFTVAAGELAAPPQASAVPPSQASNGSPEYLVNRVDEPDGSASFAPVAVELPSGPAARFERVDSMPLFADTSLLCLTVQYVVEVPTAPQQFVVLTFTSPSLAYRARLSELFGDIADTFEWAHADA